MRSKPVRSRTAVTLLVVSALLLTWLGAMFFTTGLTAESVYSEIYTDACSVIQGWESDPDTVRLSQKETRDTLRKITICNRSVAYYSPGTNSDSLRLTAEIPLQIAVTVTDGQGNPLFESGDYLYFDAHTQQQWDAGEQPGWNSEFYYIPLERNELYAPLYECYKELGLAFGEGVMRITGYPDGVQFIPVQIDYVSAQSLETFYRQYFAELGHPNKENLPHSTYMPLSQFQDVLAWETLLQKDAGDKTLSTIYTYRPQMTVFSGSTVTYQGEKYSSTLDLLHRGDFSAERNTGPSCESALSKLLFFKQYYLTDTTDPDADGFAVDRIVTCGVYANPLKGAIRSLIPVYILTGLLTVAVGWILLIILQKKLLAPVEAAGCAMEQDWNPDRTDYSATWREPALLNYQVRVESRNRKAAQDKITRLETALSYAQTAEENRRQLTSHIAHELKTPLAIIHSYTEGLKEHIAEEKRDQYLDTILSETERMDAMVMEMLDLSRLEAGKVTLTRTAFSLGALVQTVYDTFSALAQEKQLQVQLSLSDDATVLADEARIEQVLRNFLSNAVRYTPEGGTVHIKTSTQYIRLRKTVSFCVENSGHHFSQQELEKLWDSFYQADPSRSSRGTGLGLAICKNIISLHGGTCGAKNTDLGVEFQFTLQ